MGKGRDGTRDCRGPQRRLRNWRIVPNDAERLGIVGLSGGGPYALACGALAHWSRGCPPWPCWTAPSRRSISRMREKRKSVA